VLRTDREASLSLTCDGGSVQAVSSPPVAFQTLAGRPVYAPGEACTAWLTLPASCSPSGIAVVERSLALPGQTTEGPLLVRIPW
jgi:hypothetical protein